MCLCFVCEFVKLLSKYGVNDSRQKEKIRRIFKMNEMLRECRSRRWSQVVKVKRKRKNNYAGAGLVGFGSVCISTARCVCVCLCRCVGSWQTARNEIHSTENGGHGICAQQSPSVCVLLMRYSVKILKRKLSMTYVCHAKAMAKITTDCCNFIISNMRCAPLCSLVWVKWDPSIYIIQCIDLILVQKRKKKYI